MKGKVVRKTVTLGASKGRRLTPSERKPVLHKPMVINHGKMYSRKEKHKNLSPDF